MILKPLKTGLVAAFVAIGVAGVFWLRESNVQLRQRSAILRRQGEELGRLRVQNAHARALLAQTTAGGDDAARAIHAEVERLRREIAAREQSAEARRAQREAGVAALAANRDPEQGLVRVENFQNVGQSTPSAGFQTLVWAAMTGDDRVAMNLVGFEPAAREQTMALIAELPASVRTKYPTPESLAVLFFANFITGHDAARILGQVVRDPQHATVTVGLDLASSGRPFPMQRGPDGWQLAVTEAMMPELLRQVRGAPERPGGK